MRKLKKQNGFTLVEMLIVVAIIAILIAVSIPMVGSALERSRVAVDEANERDAQSLAAALFLTDNKQIKAYAAGRDAIQFAYHIDPSSHQGKIVVAGIAAPEEHLSYGASSTPRGFGDGVAPVEPKGKCIRLTMNMDGMITKLEWVDASAVTG